MEKMQSLKIRTNHKTANLRRTTKRRSIAKIETEAELVIKREVDQIEKRNQKGSQRNGERNLRIDQREIRTKAVVTNREIKTKEIDQKITERRRKTGTKVGQENEIVVEKKKAGIKTNLKRGKKTKGGMRGKKIGTSLKTKREVRSRWIARSRKKSKERRK
jgi:hypothetical protein